MGRFRALLLGVAEYDDPGVKDLPFVTDDLVNVAMALEARGCAVEVVDGSGRLGRTRINTEVSRFLVTARPDDTLLVYLSGHGAHSDNVDYLLPTDADLRWLRLADVAVPLTVWESMIESSRAAGVLFLVDACREGFYEDVKSIVARTAWAQEKIARAARRNVAWLFPCSPGEVARYVSDGPENTSFSLFARAVERAIADVSAPTTLSAVRNAVTEHMAVLATEYHLPCQQIRLRGEADHDAFVVLPGVSVASGGADDWVEAAAGHVAWQKVYPVPGHDTLRDDVISLVRRLAVERQKAGEKLGSDPWHDPRFALRMSERMNFILGSLLGDLRLSPAEAALLVAVPFAHDAHWACTAAALSSVRPAELAVDATLTPDREAFEAFVRKHPRLLRRAVSAGAADSTGIAAQIGWWLLHRWITGQASAFSSQAISALLAGQVAPARLAGEVLVAGRLSEMVRLLYADPGFIARTDRPQGLSASLVVAPGRIGEQELRERMVGYLLIVAHRMAIETTRLSSVVIEHVGIAQPVVPSAVLHALDEARWEPRGAGRVLRAACSHPAIEVALREHVAALDRLLTDIRNSDDPSLAPLEGLPGHADADQVRAAETDGLASYTSAGIRFQLDEERVQELLMGEQLYGDEDLAIREIYQNALDACRYRRARNEYLRRTGTRLPEWEGRIRFTQGIDDQGRPYIDCEDNGIGMGVRELRDVFAQAGVRFAELPEFLEEQAEWEALDPPVMLYPNSQFGIGVLSYFMLADEITVTTCRLGRDGMPGRRLRVSIAGPGTLFHIQDQGPGTDAGTVLRLHLRIAGDKRPVSCTETLRRVLWYAEFRVEAVDGAFVEIWLPRQLRRISRGTLHPVPGMPVWWCDDWGAVLADGLTTDESCFGVIVNLTGESTSELSVDRKNLVESARNRRILTRVLSDAVHVFGQPDGPMPTFDWLCEFVEEQPVVADLIFQTAVGAGRALTLNGWALDFARIGMLSSDRHLLASADSYRRPEYSARSQARRRERRGTEPLTDHLMRWRLAALNRFGDARDLVMTERARPSDAIILDTNPRFLNVYGREHCWLPVDKPVSTRHIVAAAIRTWYSIGEVACRLDVLGYRVPSALCAVVAVEPADLILISRDLDGEGPWLRERDKTDTPIPVDTGHLVAAAAQLGRSIGQVADRLAALGFFVPAGLTGMGAAEPSDRILVSRDLDGRYPWLEPYDASGQPIDVPAGHVLAAAAQLGRDVGRVAERLVEFGFAVLGDLMGRGQVEPEDRVLISRHLDGRSPMLSGAVTVPIGHVLLAAERLEQGIDGIARRLTGLGFRVPGAAGKVEQDDLVIMSTKFDGEPPWLPMEGRVHSQHVIGAAMKVNRPVGEVARRLSTLGFDVPEELPHAGNTQPGDHLMVTRELTEEPSYLLPQWDEDDILVPVPIGHAVAVAEKLGCSVGQAARRLAQIGFLVSPAFFTVGPPEPGDRVLASRDLTGEWPWLANQMVPLGHLVTAAQRSGRTLEETAERLEALGFAVPPLPNRPVDTNDVILISRELAVLPSPDALHARRSSECGWWLDHEVPVPIWNVVTGAAQTNMTIPQVMDRMRSLDFEVPDISHLIDISEFSQSAAL